MVIAISVAYDALVLLLSKILLTVLYLLSFSFKLFYFDVYIAIYIFRFKTIYFDVVNIYNNKINTTSNNISFPFNITTNSFTVLSIQMTMKKAFDMGL